MIQSEEQDDKKLHVNVDADRGTLQRKGLERLVSVVVRIVRCYLGHTRHVAPVFTPGEQAALVGDGSSRTDTLFNGLACLRIREMDTISLSACSIQIRSFCNHRGQCKFEMNDLSWS